MGQNQDWKIVEIYWQQKVNALTENWLDFSKTSPQNALAWTYFCSARKTGFAVTCGGSLGIRQQCPFW